MKREHPVSPMTGVGVINGSLFFSHRNEIKMQSIDTAIAIKESVRIFELKMISLFTLLRTATAHPNAGRLIKYEIRAILFPFPPYLETKRNPKKIREAKRIEAKIIFAFCFAFSPRIKLRAPRTYFETSTSSAS